jgi:hypothetical protein
VVIKQLIKLIKLKSIRNYLKITIILIIIIKQRVYYHFFFQLLIIKLKHILLNCFSFSYHEKVRNDRILF